MAVRLQGYQCSRTDHLRQMNLFRPFLMRLVADMDKMLVAEHVDFSLADDGDVDFPLMFAIHAVLESPFIFPF